MRKQDLRDGMVIETKAGNRYLIVCDCKFASRLEGYFDLDTHCDDLTYPYNRGLSIEKVFKPQGYNTLENILKNPGTLLWERKQKAKEYTVSELERILGYPIKIVKEY